MTVEDSLQQLAVMITIFKIPFIHVEVCVHPPTSRAECITHNRHKPHYIPFQIYLPDSKLPIPLATKQNGPALPCHEVEFDDSAVEPRLSKKPCDLHLILHTP